MVHNNSAEATLLCDAGLVVLAQRRSFHSVLLLSPSEIQWHHMDLGFWEHRGETLARSWARLLTAGDFQTGENVSRSSW